MKIEVEKISDKVYKLSKEDKSGVWYTCEYLSLEPLIRDMVVSFGAAQDKYHVDVEIRE